MAKDTHGENGEKWIGFDLDGTLAEYNGWEGIEHIGKPIKPMCDLIKKFHEEGTKVKIITARVAPANETKRPEEAKRFIRDWCEKNLGFIPDITHEKDSLMESMYDDRAVQVIPNEGITVEEAALHIFKGRETDTAKALIDYLTDES